MGKSAWIEFMLHPISFWLLLAPQTWASDLESCDADPTNPTLAPDVHLTLWQSPSDAGPNITPSNPTLVNDMVIEINDPAKDNECSICLDEILEDSTDDGQKPKSLPCKHTFHANCIAKWIEAKPNVAGACPKCRKDENGNTHAAPAAPLQAPNTYM